MTNNNPRPDHDDLEAKLNEIKSTLHIRTTTSSVFDEIKAQIESLEKQTNDRLKKIEKDTRQGTIMSIAIFAGSYLLTGAVLTLTAITLPKAYFFGWGIMGVGLIAFVWCYYKYKRLDR